MPHAIAHSVEMLTTVLTLAGMGYFLAALIAARAFLSARRAPLPAFAPGVSILKSLKGLDPGMIDAFRSHCRQTYAGEYELLFGVSSLDDPAAAAVEQLKQEFSSHAIQLVECPARLGANGKVSNLVQLAAHARYDFLLINDSDITVSPHYLERVMAHFAPQPNASSHAAKPQRETGLVTSLYRGRAHRTLPSRLEALGIATDFQAGVLLSRMIERGLHYGLGSTLAVSREALEAIGGLETLVDHLADDYELGARVDRAGYRVALSAEVVETGVPAYNWRGFIDHQLRWSRTVRDARPWGYAGLIFTHGLAWALLNVVASGVSPLSLWLLGLSFFLRLTVAMTVGAQVLADHQTLPALWLLPLRDLVAMGIWAAGFAGNTIVWRGQRFELKNGELKKLPEPIN
ncbi:MAG TPA: bacteriohopanetetrol glucosamine biosynthesis glycosyltransferase HpnI [Terracidiphilus sp.]|nr:bacteriohopanetetrol glucosamine biosynthesis glycosyltransferase HpnI [Terracidiphilus sp.]